jgi:hypothetical protein
LLDNTFKKINYNSLDPLYLIILVTVFFPYVTFYSFGTDIQPWNILYVTLFTAIMLISNTKISKSLIFLFLPVLYALFLFVLSVNKFDGLRSFLGYFTIAFVPFVTLYILERKYQLFVRILKISTIIYMIVGIIQMIYKADFLISILGRLRTTLGRGFTSLSPEPTAYGLICIFLLLIFLTLTIENKKKYIYMLLFQIVFIAQSSMTILFLLIFVFYKLLFKMNIKIVFVSILSVIVFILLYDSLLSFNSRSMIMLNSAINSPTDIVYRDQSINDRASAIYFSIKGFIDNYFIGNGFSKYAEYLNNELPKQTYFWYVSTSNRIMSYYGSILFELGFIGLLIPFTYSAIIFQAYKRNLKDMLVYLLFLNTILFSAIALSFPLVGVYIATLLYKAKNK